MGYNNHHAGLHMIQYGRYGQYDDLKYYDDLANKKETKQHDVLDNKKEIKQQDISLKNYELGNLPVINILITAMKKKKDIYDIITACEDKIKNDPYLNDTPQSYQIFVLLSLIADRLGCSLSSLFVDGKESRKTFIYELIDTLKSDDIYTIDPVDLEFDIYDSNDPMNKCDSFKYTHFDYLYGMTKELMIYSSDNIIENYVLQGMELEFYRKCENGKYYYSVSFGDLYYRDNMIIEHGAYLWTETYGKLQEFINGVFEENIWK